MKRERPSKERVEEIRRGTHRESERDLLAEIDALQADLECRGIHTCHDACRNPFCLMRKKCDAQAEMIKVAREALARSMRAPDMSGLNHAQYAERVLARLDEMERGE